jgi:hypothetical protein
MASSHRLSASSFQATEYVGGARAEEEQHIAPALGLFLHCVELDRDARRQNGMVVARLGYDIVDTVPIAAVDATVKVVGRDPEANGRALSSCWCYAHGDEYCGANLAGARRHDDVESLRTALDLSQVRDAIRAKARSERPRLMPAAAESHRDIGKVAAVSESTTGSDPRSAASGRSRSGVEGFSLRLSRCA